MTNPDQDPAGPTRRRLLECMGWAGTGLLWSLQAGVPAAVGLHSAAAGAATAQGFSFLPISDTHVGFDKPAMSFGLEVCPLTKQTISY